MLIEWHLTTGFAGCEYGDAIEVDDDTTDEEIDAIVRDEVFSCVEWGWKKVEEREENA